VILSIAELIISFLLGALVTAYVGFWYHKKLAVKYLKIVNEGDNEGEIRENLLKFVK